jgi:hypothetical protein
MARADGEPVAGTVGEKRLRLIDGKPRLQEQPDGGAKDQREGDQDAGKDLQDAH